MDTNLVLNPGFNELVFENRHKNYGAYQIRRSYRRSVLIASLIASGVLLAAFGGGFLSMNNAMAAIPPGGGGPVMHTITIVPDVPHEKEQPKETKTVTRPPSRRGSDASVEPEVVPHDTKPPAVPSDSVGSPNGLVKGGPGTTPLDTTGTPCVGCNTDTLPVKHKDPVVIATDPPEFDGIDLFFQKNLRYPVMAKEQGIEGTVWLSWVVNTRGEIQDVKVIKGTNPLLDREALRVAKAMPNWKPGSDHGQPVDFLYRKPIRFVLAK